MLGAWLPFVFFAEIFLRSKDSEYRLSSAVKEQ
jgi:hypothetical protein